MGTAKQLTETQRKALLNITNGRSSAHGLSGRSEMGGHAQTMMSLYRLELVTIKGEITERGINVLQAGRLP